MAEKVMSTSGYQAHQIFKAVRLHFISDFDYFKYGPNTKDTTRSFITRPDWRVFVKLGRLYGEDDLPYYAAVCFRDDQKIWVHDLFLRANREKFAAWKLRQQSRVTYLRQDLQSLHDLSSLITAKEHQYPELFNMVQRAEINIDTYLILDFFMKLSESWNKVLKDDVVWQTFYKPYSKYVPFMINHQYFDSNAYKAAIAAIAAIGA